jgi:DNA sulfur modification protein DndB
MRSFQYALPAVRGAQAGRDCFVTMCPFALIPTLFPVDGIEVGPERRAQRAINSARVPEITRYLKSHAKSYVLSALTASVDGKVRFEAAVASDDRTVPGTLYVPMTARFVLHDGVHRAAAITAAVREKPALANETISLVLFVDPDLKRAEQIFTDLKSNEARAARSSSILHDHADEIARLTRALVTRIPLFASRTEMHRTKISNRSLKLFTLSGIYHGTRLLLADSTELPYAPRLRLAAEFWTAIIEQIPDWQRAVRGEIAPAELRKNYIHAHALALAALGRAGRALLARHPNSWRGKLRRLHLIDWSRGNTAVWEGRAMIAGRLSKATACVVLTANAIKLHLGLPLDAEESQTESRFGKRR